jgi:hypothetical protein
VKDEDNSPAKFAVAKHKVITEEDMSDESVAAEDEESKTNHPPGYHHDLAKISMMNFKQSFKQKKAAPQVVNNLEVPQIWAVTKKESRNIMELKKSL